MANEAHYSVLLKESIDALVVDVDAVYVDGTFGRGGHSREILKRLSDKGRLVAFDKDPEAVAIGRQLEEEDARFSIRHNSFAAIDQELQEKVAGVFLDLGVSSPQLDQAQRGFSFMKDGPLDMRMNNQDGVTAAQWIAEAKQEDIAFALKEYGEERFAKRIAGAIVEHRELKPIETTLQLAKIVTDANPRWEKGKNPATRAFQGIRIQINSELDDLMVALDTSLQSLLPLGRLVVISFHSLEDRIVKRFFRDKSRGKEFPIGVPVTEAMLEKELKIIGKPIKASEAELEENIRSRSAVLRVAERLG